MTFKAQPSRFAVSIAPTNRARCKRCRQTISKGALRVVESAFVRPGRRTVRCVHLTSACIGRLLTLVGGADHVALGKGVTREMVRAELGAEH